MSAAPSPHSSGEGTAMQQPETSLEKSHSLTEDSWWHCLSLLPGADAFGELLCKDTPPTPQMLIVASLTCPSFFELKCPRSFVYLDSAITPSSLLPSSLAGTEVGEEQNQTSLLPGSAQTRWVCVSRPHTATEGWPW